jgi:hypothetical protein
MGKKIHTDGDSNVVSGSDFGIAGTEKNSESLMGSSVAVIERLSHGPLWRFPTPSTPDARSVVYAIGRD